MSKFISSRKVFLDNQWHTCMVRQWGVHVLYFIDDQLCDGSGFASWTTIPRSEIGPEDEVQTVWTQLYGADMTVTFSR